MVRIVVMAFFLLVFLFGLSFSALNADPVAIQYYFGRAELPLSLLLVIALAIGALLGVLASSFMVLKSKAEVARLKRQMAVVNREVKALRALPVKDLS